MNLAGTNFVMVGDIIANLMNDLESGKRCPCVWGPVDEASFNRGDSVLEKRFWAAMNKTRKTWHGAVDQFPIGRFRVDCLIDCDGKLVVVELDGKTYHDALADDLRDKELLKSVDAIIRVPFAAMWHYEAATMKVLSQWFPRFAVTNYAVRSLTEFYRELQDVEDGHTHYYNRGEYLEDHENAIDVWELDGNVALVGSPSGFLHTNKRHRVWIQRGKADPSLMERLYQKSGCIHEVAN